MLVKVLPLIAIAGLGGTIAINRERLGNSEEILIDEMSQGYEDIEKDWGNGEDKTRRISVWKNQKKEGSFKRSKEVREETHKDIFIFDLCNQWIEFGGNASNRESQNDGREKDKSEGYGYMWKDICNIVKSEGSEVDWLEFVTKLMKTQGVIKVNDCCQEEELCQGNTRWEDGAWIKKCFEIEKTKLNHGSKKKICKSIWNYKDSEVDKLIGSHQEIQCIDEELEKKLSQKIKISRDQFGDKGVQTNGSDTQKFWCTGNNSYIINNGETGDGSISEECKKTLKEEIKKFVNKDKSSHKRDECKAFYRGRKLEVKCNNGWFIKSSES